MPLINEGIGSMLKVCEVLLQECHCAKKGMDQMFAAESNRNEKKRDSFVKQANGKEQMANSKHLSAKPDNCKKWHHAVRV